MSSIDFFMHPELAIMAKVPDNLPSFMIRMYEAASEADEAVLVYSPLCKQGMWHSQFPEHRRLESVVREIDGKQVYRGEIMARDFGRLAGLLKGKNEIRIHGNYLAKCTQALAAQILAYLKDGDQWCSWNDEAHAEWDRQQEKMSLYTESGAFRDSPIRLGIVMASRIDENVDCSKTDVRGPKVPDMPFGDATYQMIDGHTFIYGKDRINFGI